MKKIFQLTILVSLVISLFSLSAYAQTSATPAPKLELRYPWTDKQLIAPLILAADLREAGEHHFLILNIGAVEDIKGAKHIGAVSNADNLEKMIESVTDLPKNTAIIIYCGCCPFAKCPNVKPAFLKLQMMGFANIKILDIPVNLKTNWIGKGYPLAGK